MIGRFKKAPLTIVSLRLQTSELPGFVGSQLNELRQKMVKREMIHHEVAEVQKIQFPSESGQLPRATGASFFRHGFFNSSRTESMFLDIDGIEWRMTDYVGFSSFNAKILEMYKDLMSTADFLPFVELNAVLLTYSDLIVPFEDRKLSDYFLKKEFVPSEANPLSGEGRFTFGMNQFARVFDDETRLTVSLEQYPYTSGQQFKIVHDSMIETHPNFTNRVKTMSHWDNPQAETYGVMLMQGSWAKRTKIATSRWEEQLVKLNENLSHQFEYLLDRDVCDSDWEYENV